MDGGGPRDNSQQERLLPSFQERLPLAMSSSSISKKGGWGLPRTLGCSGPGDTLAGPHLGLSQVSIYKVTVMLPTRVRAPNLLLLFTPV